MIKPGEIHIKDSKVLRGIMERMYAPLLVTINCEVADKFGLFIADAWVDPLGKSTILKGRVYGSLEMAEQIKSWINKRWEYDTGKSKEVAVIYGIGKGILFRLQCSNNTRLRQL